MSKKDVSSVLSGAGWIGSLASGVINALRELGATEKQIHSLVVDGGELPVGKIAVVLMEEIRKQESPRVGKFFTTVKLGKYPTIDALRNAIKECGKKISTYADQILGKISISVTEEEVDIWEVTGAEMGFTEAVSRIKIYNRIHELGFTECPAEAIALVRIECNDGKWRIGAMEPITGSGGDLRILDLGSDGGGLYLHALYGSPGGLWRPACVWLVARPRRK